MDVWTQVFEESDSDDAHNGYNNIKIADKDSELDPE